MQLFQYLILASILHVLIWFLAPSERQFIQEELPIEVTYIEKQGPKKRVLLVDPQVQKLEDAAKKLKKAADKLSSVTQRVQKEQATQGAHPIDQQRAPAPQAQQRQAWEPPPLDALPGLAKKELADSVQPSQNRLRTFNIGDHEFSRSLPEVEAGSFTALNTDQFMFYTFHARTRQQIGNRWVENLRYTLNRMDPNEYDSYVRSRQITEFEIIMSPEGEFVKVLYRQRSGSKKFDEAAVLSIVRSSPFVNPPAEMVQDDGYIHLNYSFEVRLKPRSWASRK